MRQAHVLRTKDFARDAATFIVEQARVALSTGGLFRLGLAGGKTPGAVYEEVSRLGAELPWSRVWITFGDERCVPDDDAESNYLLARKTLLDRIAMPSSNVLRIRGEIEPETAAAEYEERLAEFAAQFGETRYVHDLLLLGLGPDGHTASLFPQSPALHETKRNVVPVIGPKPPNQRITFTFPLINAARQIGFLVNDPAKLPLVEAILEGRSRLPAADVRPSTGMVAWIVGV
jgi:6-phosphogluconolactonase